MTQRMTAADLIRLTGLRVGVSIAYPGDAEPFHVERAAENGYGAVQIFDYSGRCHGLSGLAAEVEVLGTFNL